MDNIQATILGSRIANHKRRYFGTADVEIKSNWLRIPQERKERYLDKYPITEKQLEDFVNELYDIVSSTELMLIAAVIDKQHMQEDYGADAWYAPAVAYEILLQRIVLQVSYPDTVSVVIDDMDGATPKGNQYKTNLRRHHKSLKKNGSRLFQGLNWGPLQRLKFKNSALSHHIQIADIVAYNVYRQFVEYGEDWENKANTELPTYGWLEKLAGKFRDKDGRIQGYGIIKMPLRERRKWGIKK